MTFARTALAGRVIGCAPEGSVSKFWRLWIRSPNAPVKYTKISSGARRANPIGRAVKHADLQDNCDLSRISNPSERDFQRIEKYKKAIDLIGRLATSDA
jgi:hypothetical protein